MSATVDLVTTRRAPVAEVAGAVLLSAAGVGLLLIRPALVSLTASPAAALALCYTGLWALALATPKTIAGWANVADADRGRKGVVLAAGLAAVAVARFVVWPGAAIRVGAVALLLNVLAAVAEEAFFRRFLYGWLAVVSVALAVTGSALTFALVHVPAYGAAAFPVDLGAGLLLSWQRWASGDWRISAATHVAANLMVVMP